MHQPNKTEPMSFTSDHHIMYIIVPRINDFITYLKLEAFSDNISILFISVLVSVSTILLIVVAFGVTILKKISLFRRRGGILPSRLPY